MSLQDDYFEIDAYLKSKRNKEAKAMRKAFNRIWEYFIELENEVDGLRELKCSFRKMLWLTLPELDEADFSNKLLEVDARLKQLEQS